VSADAVGKNLSRLKAFWARENHDRPLIGFTGGYFPSETIQLLTVRDGQIYPDSIDIPAFLACCDEQYSAWDWATGDLFWSAAPLWGLPWVSAILGQPLYASSETIWTEPVLKNYDKLNELCNLENNLWLDALLNLGSRLAEHVQGRYPLGAISSAAPLVLLTDMRGITEFGLHLYDPPQELEKALAKITDVYLNVFQRYFNCIPKWHGGYGSGTRFMWAPGLLVEYDEDSSYILSPEFQQKFVMPLHRRIIDSFNFAYLHLHSSQLHTFDTLLADDRLKYFELTPDVGCDISELIPSIQRIREQKCVIVHGYLTAEDFDLIIESMPPEGLCIISRVSGPEQANLLQDKII